MRFMVRDKIDEQTVELLFLFLFNFEFICLYFRVKITVFKRDHGHVLDISG